MKKYTILRDGLMVARVLIHGDEYKAVIKAVQQGLGGLDGYDGVTAELDTSDEQADWVQPSDEEVARQQTEDIRQAQASLTYVGDTSDPREGSEDGCCG